MNAPLPNAPQTLRPGEEKGGAGGRDIPFLADNRHGPDLLGISDALQPLVELIAHRDSQTPMMIAIVGPSGAGKSFVLNRIVSGVEVLGAAAKSVDGPFASEIVTVRVDAASIAADPAASLAAATYAALSRDHGEGGYGALADEAAHAGGDPHLAAAKATERYDEARRRLDAERQTRDETEARRARLSDAVLFETPGSRVDAYVPASRGRIESRLRRFDLVTGEPGANFKELVRDVAGAGAGSRVSVLLRSIWAFRRQTRLLLYAVVCFLAALVVGELRAPVFADWLRGLGAPAASVADWLQAHGDWIDYAVAALAILGALALALNLWRAFLFAGSLDRAARLLNHDVRDRARDLDAASARLNRRIATLSAEAEAAARHAETAEQRAKLRGPVAVDRGSSPLFLDSTKAPQAAARAFFAVLDKGGEGAGELGAPPVAVAPAAPLAIPKRIVLAVDNLDALSPSQALHVIETTRSLLGQSFVALLAFDPSRLAPVLGADETLQGGRLDGLFQIVFNAGQAGAVGGERLVARLLGGGAGQAPRPIEARQSVLREPVGAAEGALLTALAPIAAATPRGAKRYINIYRLARVGASSRAALAVALAVAQGGDPEAQSALSSLLEENPDGVLPEPRGPAALVDALRAARASGVGSLRAADLVEAQAIARRYQLMA
ncbi:MAG TPA: P-loop NTPase fold protein [Roseiarcus sp.]|nr:P-loop NTPase fold protein [Roseiarcus sp.]